MFVWHFLAVDYYCIRVSVVRVLTESADYYPVAGDHLTSSAGAFECNCAAISLGCLYTQNVPNLITYSGA